MQHVASMQVSGAILKKVGIGIVLAALLGTPAMAADMAVKVPATLAPPAYDRSGFYIGGNIGYGIGRNRGTDTLLFPDGTVFASKIITQAPAGALGGGQVGAWAVTSRRRLRAHTACGCCSGSRTETSPCAGWRGNNCAVNAPRPCFVRGGPCHQT